MKTFVYIGTSLDGFIARKNGVIDWLIKFEGQEVNESFTEFMNKIDAIVMGRGTFETVVTFPFWPYDKKVFVLSTTLTQIPDRLKDKAVILSMNPKEVLGFLANQGFFSIYIDGGKVIQSFLEEDYIDELIITRVPVLIGSGIPLFGYLSHDILFSHVRTKVYSNGLVQSNYERKRG